MLNSSSLSLVLYFFKSSMIYHVYVSIPLRSPTVHGSPRTNFQNIGGKWSGIALNDLIALPNRYPTNLNISRWVGVELAGLGTKQSLFSPWLFLLFTDLIINGRDVPSISPHRFVRVSLYGPPASIEPSPINLAENAF
jgi:hypothetical protein